MQGTHTYSSAAPVVPLPPWWTRPRHRGNSQRCGTKDSSPSTAPAAARYNTLPRVTVDVVVMAVVVVAVVVVVVIGGGGGDGGGRDSGRLGVFVICPAIFSVSHTFRSSPFVSCLS